MSWTSRGLRACVAIALSLGVANYCSADLLVYEPFDYPEGSELLGAGGAENGFGAAWTGRENNPGNVPNNSTSIQDGSLMHTGLPTLGGHVVITGEHGTSQPARDLSPFAKSQLASASSVWFSFLGQRLGEAVGGDNPYPRGVNLSLFREDVATNFEIVGFGNSSNATNNTWSMIPRGGGGNRVGAFDPVNSTIGGNVDLTTHDTYPFENLEWVVVRIDYNNDPDMADDIRMWLSPDPTQVPDDSDAVAVLTDADVPEASKGTFQYGGIGAIRPFIGNVAGGGDIPFGVFAIDEIRIGTSYAAMSSTQVIPEPSALCLLLLGSFGLLARRRAG